MVVNFNLPANTFVIKHFCFFSVVMIIWYGFDAIIFYELKAIMNTISIAFFIVSLILPAASSGLVATVAGNQSPGVESDEARLALEYSDERSIEKAEQNTSIRWYTRKNNTKLNGVALVIHGLNSRPDKMESIIARMNDFGIDCLNLSLRGHGGNYSAINHTDSADARMETFKSVTYPLWKTEAYQAYQRVEKISKLYATPLFFVGFSMGGLLGVDLLSSHPGVKFDKMVLFAPAIKMHKRNSLLKILSPFPRIVIPSIAHRSYLTNEGTSMAAYNALFEMYGHLQNNLDPKKINIPTVVFIDRQDELISFSGLQNMIRDQNLDQWKIHPVKKDKTETKIKMHHLIIDKASVGNYMWQEIVNVTITHFLGLKSASTINE
jgi:alpha-beta hydrolase superfamily lysophospholipase